MSWAASVCDRAIATQRTATHRNQESFIRYSARQKDRMGCALSPRCTPRPAASLSGSVRRLDR